MSMKPRITSITVTCPRCAFAWRSRVANPKTCPRCRRRLDAKFLLKARDGQA